MEHFNIEQIYRFARYGYKMDKMFTKMWKVLFGLSILFMVGSMQYKATDWDYFRFVQEANKLNSYDLDEYVMFYIHDMEANGFNIDSLLHKQKKADIRFKDMGRNTIGRADGMFDNDIIDMKISPRWWKKLNNAERLYVIYHEAGHDFWFKWHGSSWIMSRSKKATGKITWKKLYERRQEYFESIRRGRTYRPRLIYGIGVPPQPRTDNICKHTEHGRQND